ncbi:hypothetical protein H4R35_002902 [Dimargaris xerosporica]|nr:hypothetical protein H4R35_002902 [Dimargaris xerosporica]
MISAEAPILFSKSCEIMILELTLRAWMHAEENKRRTLQRSDIAMAITKTDIFDFLIDIVPREESVRASSSKHEKSDVRSNMPQDQGNYSYMAYQHNPSTQLGAQGQQGLPQQQLMQMQYLRNQLLQQPGSASGVNAPQSPLQVSQVGQPGLMQSTTNNPLPGANLQGQAGHPYYSQQYGYTTQNVNGSQPMGGSGYGQSPRQ